MKRALTESNNSKKVKLDLVEEGRALYEMENYDAAKEYFTKALNKDPESEEALNGLLDVFYKFYQLGVENHTGKNYEAAIANFTKCLELFPRDFSARLLRGDCHRQRGDYDAALRDLKAALTEFPENPKVLSLMGEVYCLKENYDLAIKYLTKALQKSPGFASKTLEDVFERLWDRADQKYFQENYMGALVDLSQALNVKPCPMILNRRAEVFRQIGNEEFALQDENCARLRANSSDDIHALWQRGYRYYEENNYDGAIIYFTMALDRDPNDATLWNYLGNAFLQIGDSAAAIDAAKRALDDENFDALQIMGEAFLQQGNYERAYAYASEALEVLENRDTLLLMGKACFQKGRAIGSEEAPPLDDCDEVIKVLTAALAADPDDPDLYVSRAGAYLQKGKMDQAIADASIAIELEEPTPALLIRAGAYFQKGSHDEAIDDARAALEVEPDNGRALQLMGKACFQKAQMEFAKVEIGNDLPLFDNSLPSFFKISEQIAQDLGKTGDALRYNFQLNESKKVVPSLQEIVKHFIFKNHASVAAGFQARQEYNSSICFVLGNLGITSQNINILQAYQRQQISSYPDTLPALAYRGTIKI